eukprot:2112485-Amphidinium_carterae.1
MEASCTVPVVCKNQDKTVSRLGFLEGDVGGVLEAARTAVSPYGFTVTTTSSQTSFGVGHSVTFTLRAQSMSSSH